MEGTFPIGKIAFPGKDQYYSLKGQGHFLGKRIIPRARPFPKKKIKEHINKKDISIGNTVGKN